MDIPHNHKEELIMAYAGNHHSERMALHQAVADRARNAGIELTPEHWDAIEFVLEVYENCPECRHARQMSELLDAEFKERGGRKYLYPLFPSGPVRQISDLVQLKQLENETDRGFGTSY
jgi:tRNA 2-thiouridine synthesizing protein E